MNLGPIDGIGKGEMFEGDFVYGFAFHCACVRSFGGLQFRPKTSRADIRPESQDRTLFRVGHR